MSQDKLQELIDRLDNHEKRISSIEKVIHSPERESIGKKYSIKEFILTKNPKGDTEKTLVIGYFLEKYQDYESFNIADLDEYYRKAKEKVPPNMNDKVNMNIGKGLMMEAKEKKDKRKAWILTSSGEKYIENNLKEPKNEGNK